MKLIPLVSRKSNLPETHFMCDEQDYDRLIKYVWYLDHYGYATNGEKKAHQLVCPCTKPLMVDHINRNKLDNRRANLRIVDNRQNQQNSARGSKSSSYKGVRFRPDVMKWQARIRIDGKLFSIGYYPDEVSAAEAYDTFAAAYFGEYARLNFPR